MLPISKGNISKKEGLEIYTMGCIIYFLKSDIIDYLSKMNWAIN